MRSHLTRTVIRRILSNEPILHKECIYSTSRPALGRRIPLSKCTAPQQRTIFGWTRKPERKVRDSDLDPGLELLAQYNSMKGLGERPPPDDELADAFIKLVISKTRISRKGRETLKDIQAALAFNAYKHLRQVKRENGEPIIPYDILRRTLEALLQRSMPREAQAMYRNFANIVHDDLVERGKKPKLDILTEIYVLASALNEAREYALQYTKQADADATRVSVLWALILEGYGKEGNRSEINRTLEMMRDSNVAWSSKLKEPMVLVSIREDDLAAVKEWSTKAVEVKTEEDIEVYGGMTDRTALALLEYCVKKHDLDFGRPLLAKLAEQPRTELWNVVFLWAVAEGKDINEVERLIRMAIKHNQKTTGQGSFEPDIQTFNKLAEYAMSSGNFLAAERYLTLGRKFNAKANAETHLMQMRYRMKAGDIEGAVMAYRNLQSVEVTADEDVPLINELIQKMCTSKRYNYDTIMEVVAELAERKVHMEPATVSALCVLHLNREEYHDVVDLLQSYAFHYSRDQRREVRDGLYQYCLDRSNSTSRAWDTYMIFHQIFDETDRTIRIAMMDMFFSRGRSDMAYHVFQHMRDHPRPDTRADEETYVKVLVGIAGAKYAEGLEQVHNQMKLDFEIEPSTRLYNALMIAYAACEMPDRALEFWDDIAQSREGPTYGSICIALRACERSPFGEKHAKSIWTKLNKMDVEITKELYTAYVGALAGNRLWDEAQELVLGLEERTGFVPDAFMLGSMYNATRGTAQQQAVEDWIREAFPHIWEELAKLGTKTLPETGTKLINIDRTLTP